MALFDDLQRVFDNREPEYNDSEEIKEEEKINKIQEQIKIIEQDAENYGDMTVDAIAEYLTNEDGIPDDIILGLKVVINCAVYDHADKHDEMFKLINSAIEWKAKQIVENDNE